MLATRQRQTMKTYSHLSIITT